MVVGDDALVLGPQQLAAPITGETGLVSYEVVLELGDVVNTGTSPGVGFSLVPPRYLKEGDVMELRIAGLGVQRQVVRAATL
jgi:hypothetical protein